ncbi:hypothetical protein [Pedobacter sp.]
MKSKDELLMITIARQCARYSLISGTLIFMLFALTRQQWALVTGLIFALTCIAINGIIMLILLMHLIGAKQHKNNLLRALLLILINIPIAVLYGWLTVQIAQLFDLNL